MTGTGRLGIVAAPASTRAADRARFAVALLRRGLPKGALSEDSGDLLGLLARCYRGAKGDDALQTDVVVVAAALLKKNPDGAKRWGGRLARVALQTLRRVASIGGAPTGDAAEGAFKMLAALLGGRDAVVLSDTKLKAVAASGRAALADGALLDQGTLQSHRAAALQLILALINKKVVVSEVYDAMDTIADLAITSLEKSDRTKCARAFVGFVGTYPLGKKRKAHYLGKALAGLDYAYEEGRGAALDLVEGLVRALPSQEIDARADALFSSLAQRLANEESPHVRLRSQKVLTSLLRKLTDEKLTSCRGRVASWLRECSKEDRLERFAEAEKVAQLRLCGALCSGAFAKAGDSVLCSDVVKALAAAEDDDAGRAQLLIALRACVESEAKQGTDAVLASVLGALQRCGPRSRKAAHEALGAVFASGCDLAEGQARDICRAACAVLDAPDDVFEEQVATQAAKNALFCAGRHSGLAAELLKRLADAAGRRGAARRKAVFAFVAACLAHAAIGQAPLLEALDRVSSSLQRALDDVDEDVAALATDVVGRLEEALGADVVGRALAEAAAAQRRKKAERAGARAREAVMDPRGAAKRRRK